MDRRLQTRIILTIVAYILFFAAEAFFYHCVPGQHYLYYPNFAAVVFVIGLLSFAVAFWYTWAFVGWLWDAINWRAHELLMGNLPPTAAPTYPGGIIDIRFSLFSLSTSVHWINIRMHVGQFQIQRNFPKVWHILYLGLGGIQTWKAFTLEVLGLRLDHRPHATRFDCPFFNFGYDYWEKSWFVNNCYIPNKGVPPRAEPGTSHC